MKRFISRVRGVALAMGLILTASVIAAPVSAAEPMFLNYRAHVQDQGWQAWHNEPSAAGTSGQRLRMEAFQLRGGVGEVRAHVQDIGWSGWVPNGAVAGTTGRSLRMEAVQVRSGVPGWAIECQAHVQDIGWMAWVKDGDQCGTTGRSLRVEALRLRLVPVAAPPSGSGADSNVPVDQKATLIGFDVLRDQPSREALNANDTATVSVNNSSYSTARGALAVKDADSTRLSSVTVALGPRLKGYLDELTSAGKIPKFRALLSNSARRMQTPDASSNEAKAYFATTRPVFNPLLDIKRVPNAGSVYSDVGDTPDFPSGHARIFQVYATSLAVMFPEKAPELLQRGSDAGHSRAVLGVHSVLGVMGGKVVGLRMVAQRLNDPVFYNDEFLPAMQEVRAALEARCGTTIAECADGGDRVAAKDEVRHRLTYGLPRVGEAGRPLAVPDGAEALLITAYPGTSAEYRRNVLARTAVDSGYPLDITGAARPAADVGWSRIDLAAAIG